MGFEPILRGPQPRVLNPSHYGHTWCWRMDSNHRLPLCKRGTLAGLSYASELLAGEPGLAPGTHGFGDRQFRLAYSPVAVLVEFESTICAVTRHRGQPLPYRTIPIWCTGRLCSVAPGLQDQSSPD